MRKEKNRISKKFLFSSIAAIVLGSSFVAGSIAAATSTLTTRNTKESHLILKSEKTQTSVISSLCPATAFDKDLQGYLDAEFDCGPQLGITSKDDISKNKNAFIKVTPRLSKTKKVEITFSPTTVSSANAYPLHTMKLIDSKGNVIPSNTYTIATTGITNTGATVHAKLSDVSTTTVVSIPKTGSPTMTITFNNDVQLETIEVAGNSETIGAVIKSFDSSNVVINDWTSSVFTGSTIQINGFTKFTSQTKPAQMLKSKLKTIKLMDSTNKLVGYFLKGSTLFFHDEKVIPTAVRCSSELDCASRLQVNAGDDAINFGQESILLVEGTSDFTKIEVVGTNVDVEFAYRRKENISTTSVNNYVDVNVNKIGATTLTSTSLNADTDSVIPLVTCMDLIKRSSLWAYPKACDLIQKVWPYLGDDLKGKPVLDNLELKGDKLSDYPLWDVQRIEFDSTKDTKLVLDFDTYDSDQEVFNGGGATAGNKIVYTNSLFTRNATTLDELVVKGPMGDDIAVNISKLSGLKKLTLDGTNITNYSFLSLLTNLKELTITNTKLDSLASLGAVSQSLTKLDLSSNKIEALPSSFLAGRATLVSIDLSNNKITEISASDFQGLTALTSLDISMNKLTTLPDLARNLTTLSSLDISGNSIVTIPSGTVALASLRTLRAKNNSIISLPVATTATSITELDLRGNRITALGNLSTNYPNLTSLSIGGASYELNLGGINSSLATLKAYITSRASSLTTIRIEDMNLTTTTIVDLLNHIGRNTTSIVKTLSFANNQAGNISVAQVPAATIPKTVEHLDLSNQTTLSAIPAFVTNLSNLKTLNLSNNRIIVAQQIDLPDTLKEVTLSSNPLSSISRTLSSLKGVEKVIMKNVDNVLGSEDWTELGKSFSKEKVTLVVSTASFDAKQLFLAKNIFDLDNITLIVEENSEEQVVDIPEQYILNYEANAAGSLKQQLKLKDFSKSTLRNYLDETGRIFYTRPTYDKDNIDTSKKLDTYLGTIWDAALPVARDAQLSQAITEAIDATKDGEQIVISKLANNSNLVAALTLVVIILIVNLGAVGLYIVKNKKKN